MREKASITYAKPFLKWAGGKRQLLNVIETSLPKEISHWESFTYVEPFVGSGALLFWMIKTFPNLKKAIINDINPDLTKAYNVIKTNPEKLIKKLEVIQDKYYNLSSEENRNVFFYEKRNQFNKRNLNDTENTVLLIFLNRTCFNGLYRVNSKGEFNVPFGRYNHPKICDPLTIMSDSLALRKVKILREDFQQTINYADNNTLFYLDPPYKPISSTSHFTSYSIDRFDDNDQERLKEFCDLIDKKGCNFILSNSDLKNHNSFNNYFDELYSNYNIERVQAARNINSIGSKRKKIYELLITNNDTLLQVS